MTPPIFHPNLGVFPLDQIAHVGVKVSRYPELFGLENIFDIQTCVKNILIVRRTDDLLSHNRALRSIAR